MDKKKLKKKKKKLSKRLVERLEVVICTPGLGRERQKAEPGMIAIDYLLT